MVQNNVEFIMSRLSVCVGEFFGTLKWLLNWNYVSLLETFAYRFMLHMYGCICVLCL